MSTNPDGIIINENNKSSVIPELLSPAGSFESLAFAVRAGADAVYFGSTLFNARMGAKNFTREEIKEAVSLCHENNVKCYVTMNTAMIDKQYRDALLLAEYLYKTGVDALIVSDLGLASEIHRFFPDFHLHASTQASGHNSYAADFLKNIGFNRMVIARETSFTDIEATVKKSPIEIEMFVHGALCVSCSGQCLFSSIVGGRSGNRGECAQPCRLPYNSRYPLSLKDLSLANHIPELLSLGVSSLKIEGRMKSPDYVYAVTSVYRTLLDGRRNADNEEMRYLAEVFSRGGFTDGYFTGKKDSSMLGIRGNVQNETMPNPPKSILSHKRPAKTPLCIDANDSTDNTRGFSLPDGFAENYRPSDIFAKDDINGIEKSDNTEIAGKTDSPANTKPAGMKPIRSACFFKPEAIPDKSYTDYFDIIYLPLDKFTNADKTVDDLLAEKRINGVIIPPVIYETEYETIKSQLLDAVKAGAVYALVGNIGHISLALECGLVPHASHRMNICSNPAANVFKDLAETVLSAEILLAQARDIKARKSIIVYGRTPLMTLEKPLSDTTLTDRRKVMFPVLHEGHDDIIFNSVPTYMADKKDELLRLRGCGQMFIFTVEGKRETENTIDSYRKGYPTKREIRRLK